VFVAAAVWSSSYWVLRTNYNSYVVLWGCLMMDDNTIQRKIAADSHFPFTTLPKRRHFILI